MQTHPPTIYVMPLVKEKPPPPPTAPLTQRDLVTASLLACPSGATATR